MTGNPTQDPPCHVTFQLSSLHLSRLVNLRIGSASAFKGLLIPVRVLWSHVQTVGRARASVRSSDYSLFPAHIASTTYGRASSYSNTVSTAGGLYQRRG